MPLSVGQTVGCRGLVHQFGHQVILRCISWRNLRDHLVPFAAKLCVVAGHETEDAVVGRTSFNSCICPARLMVLLCHEELAVHLVGRLHGIAYNLIECRTEVRGQSALYLVHGVGYFAVLCQPLFAFFGREVRIVQTVVLLAVPLHLVTHKLRLALPGQSVVAVKDVLELRGLHGECPGEPLSLIGVGRLDGECLKVPRHIEELLHLHLHRFDITHVQQPVAPCPGVVGLLQLVVHQYGCRRGYP